MLEKKYHIVFIGILALIGSCVVHTSSARAASATDPTQFRVRLYEPSGSLITDKGFVVKVIKLGSDVEGRTIDTGTVASKNMAAIGEIILPLNTKRDGVTYAIEISRHGTKPSIFRYDEVRAVLNFTERLEYRLSKIAVQFTDVDGNVIKGQSFTVYTQKQVNGTQGVGELVAKGLVSDERGYGFAYVPPGRYVVETSGGNNQTIRRMNVLVEEEREAAISLTPKNVTFIARDSAGTLLKKIKFDVFSKKTDFDGNILLGAAVGTFTIPEDGRTVIGLADGAYRVRFFGTGNIAYELPELDIVSRINKTIEYRFGTIEFTVVNTAGTPVPKAAIAVHESGTGNVKLGKKLFNAATGVDGKVLVYVAPGSYAIQSIARKADFGPIGAGASQITRVKIVDDKQPKFTVSLSGSGTLPPSPPRGGGGSSNTPDQDKDGLGDSDEVRLGTNPRKADTDYDGFLDGDEVAHGYDPLDPRPTPKKGTSRPGITGGIFAYQKSRLSSSMEEQVLARELKQKLEALLGRSRVRISAENWPRVVNAYIYGSYNAEEIADTLRFGPRAVHPSIPAEQWRKSADYQQYLRERM